MRKKTFPLLVLVFMLAASPACAENLWDGGKVIVSVTSRTLSFEIRSFTLGKASCYGVEILMDDPGRQITKATALWRQGLGSAGSLAKDVPGCMLAINASGYVSPTYSWVPESYPGTNEDYFYTPLGSVTVTHGRVYRYMRDVPYYGLTLEEDGLHLCNGEASADVIGRNVKETWSFYEQCPLIMDGKSLLPEDWTFAHAKASRNIICKTGEGRYFVLIVTSQHGLTLFDCISYLLREIEPVWAYNLDGGPSTALYCRTDPDGEWLSVYPNRQHNVDIMAFTE